MATKHGISRRTLLRGVLGGAAVAIGLPALQIFTNDHGAAYADGTPFPKRFGIFFWGNGTLPERFIPKGTGPDWEPSSELAPLAPVKGHVNVISGMNITTGDGEPHAVGPVGMLSGAPFPPKDNSTFAVPSIDQVIASAIGTNTRFRSLEVAAQPNGRSLSWNGIHSNNPPETSPRALFDRVFGGGFTPPGSAPTVEPKIALRRSVLDAISDDARRLQGKLGAKDRARLEQHLEGIRDLEKQIDLLSQTQPSLAACAIPKAPLESYPTADGRPPLSAISRAMCDTIAMALACNQTRVFSHWFSSPVNDMLYPGTTMGHHQLTHEEADPQPQVDSIVTYTMGELAYLVSALDAIPEGATTLLGNTVILATTDVSYGRTHSISDYPILLAGPAGGALKTGIHYRSPSGESTSKVLLTLARAMGLAVDSYGEGPGRVTSGVSAIEA